MRTLIVGGGKVGNFLARELTTGGHAVVVIEIDANRAQDLSQQSDALILAGDGTDVAILGEAQADRADYLVAVTGEDEVNLVACQLAKVAFGIDKVLARLNDPRNRSTFEALDVDVVAVTDLLVQIISRELDVRELVRLALLERGELSLVECVIPADAPGRRVVDLRLPANTLLVTHERDGDLGVVGAATELLPGDKVLVLTAVETEDEVLSALEGN